MHLHIQSTSALSKLENSLRPKACILVKRLLTMWTLYVVINVGSSQPQMEPTRSLHLITTNVERSVSYNRQQLRACSGLDGLVCTGVPDELQASV